MGAGRRLLSKEDSIKMRLMARKKYSIINLQKQEYKNQPE